MASIRIWHNYLGVFIAPSVLFFSMTGAWQLFSLHEADTGYSPPPIIEKLSRVHKDQVFVRTQRDVQRDAAVASSTQQTAPGQPAVDEDEKTPLPTLLLKWFFLLVAVALIVTTLMGLWMGLRHPVRKRRSWLLLLAGAVVPIVLAAI